MYEFCIDNCQAILTSWQFLIETTANKDLVDTADAEYSKLITVNGSKYDSCIAYLDKDLARLEKAEQDALNQKQIVDTLKVGHQSPGFNSQL